MCCKLREWVWTETGKGDRLGGDRRLGPSPPSERPAPPHSLQTHKERDQRPASFTCQPVVLDRLFRMALPCHALFACLCHNPMPATLVCVCPCVHSITMCARIIAQAAGTALQAAPSTIVFACVHVHPVHHREEPGTALGSRLPPCTCAHSCIHFMNQRLHLGSLAPCFKNGLWDGA